MLCEKITGGGSLDHSGNKSVLHVITIFLYNWKRNNNNTAAAATWVIHTNPSHNFPSRFPRFSLPKPKRVSLPSRDPHPVFLYNSKKTRQKERERERDSVFRQPPHESPARNFNHVRGGGSSSSSSGVYSQWLPYTLPLEQLYFTTLYFSL